MERVSGGTAGRMKSHFYHTSRHQFFHFLQCRSHGRTISTPSSRHFEDTYFTIEKFIILTILCGYGNFIRLPVQVICLKLMCPVLYCRERIGPSLQIITGSYIFKIYILHIFGSRQYFSIGISHRKSRHICSIGFNLGFIHSQSNRSCHFAVIRLFTIVVRIAAARCKTSAQAYQT